MLESKSATEHIDRIGAALRLFDGWRQCLEALDSLAALRASIAEMERQNAHFEALADYRLAEADRLTVERDQARDQAREALEAAEEIVSGVLSVASEFGSYDGEDPGSALSCIRGELAEYSRVMWAITGILNSGSARPDDVEAAVLWAAQRIVALEEALRLISTASASLGNVTAEVAVLEHYGHLLSDGRGDVRKLICDVARAALSPKKEFE